MTRKIRIAFVLTVLTVAVMSQECGRVEKYGTAVEGGEVVSVVEILKSLEKYTGKTVRLEGKIVTECPSGCWFELQEDRAVMYVDIKAAGLAIPQRLGKHAIVKGRIKVDGKKPILLGEGVEIR